MSCDLLIVIATYNEAESLPVLVDRIWQELPDARILVVDDNSPDGTGDWVRRQQDAGQRMELLHREVKEGLGAATVAGLQQALAKQASWIATMDADLSHRPADLAALWRVAGKGEYDVVIGSRYVAGGRIENWSLRRRIASRLVNGFARWALWLKTCDNSGALRVYRAATLSQLDLQKVDCPGFAYVEQILFHLARAGATFHEVPILFQEREHGRSKVTLPELSRDLYDILKLAIRRR